MAGTVSDAARIGKEIYFHFPVASLGNIFHTPSIETDNRETRDAKPRTDPHRR
jgi:hypothetical protein